MFNEFFAQQMKRVAHFYVEREKHWPPAADAAARLTIVAQQAQIEALQRGMAELIAAVRGCGFAVPTVLSGLELAEPTFGGPEPEVVESVPIVVNWDHNIPEGAVEQPEHETLDQWRRRVARATGIYFDANTVTDVTAYVGELRTFEFRLSGRELLVVFTKWVQAITVSGSYTVVENSGGSWSLRIPNHVLCAAGYGVPVPDSSWHEEGQHDIPSNIQAPVHEVGRTHHMALGLWKRKFLNAIDARIASVDVGVSFVTLSLMEFSFKTEYDYNRFREALVNIDLLSTNSRTEDGQYFVVLNVQTLADMQLDTGLPDAQLFLDEPEASPLPVARSAARPDLLVNKEALLAILRTLNPDLTNAQVESALSTCSKPLHSSHIIIDKDAAYTTLWHETSMDGNDAAKWLKRMEVK